MERRGELPDPRILYLVKVGALLSVVRITSGGTKYHGAQRPMTHHLRQIVSGHSIDLSDWTGEILQAPPKS